MHSLPRLSFCVAAALFIVCTRAPNPVLPESTGTAQVSIKVGNVGALAKSLTINLSRLCIELAPAAGRSVYDTVRILGHSEVNISRVYAGLPVSLNDWTLRVKSIDIKDSIIHQGATVFTAVPGDTVDVTIDLAARYSMLKANFYPIRDSVTLCRLKVDRYIVADSSFPKQRLLNDTVAIAFDYLTTGADQRVGMEVWGVMWGETKLLYTGDTLINVLPGEDKRFTITLRWVGPTTPPPGAARMTVTLGAVGTVTVDGELEERGEESVVDVDGNIYSTVTIGSQTWMVENLKTSKYNDGTSIPLITDNTEWGNLTTPGYCWYENDITNKATYGALYNWYAVHTGKLAPTGWHVATDAEWTTLTSYLGDESVAGGKLKEAGLAHWVTPNTGATNETGFSALPGGWRSGSGNFYGVGVGGSWRSSTAYDATYSWLRLMVCNNANVSRSSFTNTLGFSVRCVRD